MATSLYDFSIANYLQTLGGVLGFLDRGFSHFTDNNIDPVGFALENFDADGSWRDATREGLKIDSAGILLDGTPVNGPVELRGALLADPNLFANTVAEKMLIYALGRGLAPADKPVVREIVRNAAKNDYSLVSIVLGIVDSYPFQNRTNGGTAAAATVAQTRE